MKKFAIALLCTLPCATFAADWTPVFKPWEQCKSSSIVTKIDKAVIGTRADYQKYTDAYELASQNWHGDYDDPRYNDHLASYGVDDNLLVSKNALQGKFPTIPTQYRKDMGKAYITDGSHSSSIYIHVPLNNAGLYGIPIKEYVAGFGIETESPRSYVNFGNISDAQFAKLKKIKLKSIYEEAFDVNISASFNRNEETGEVWFYDCTY